MTESVFDAALKAEEAAAAARKFADEAYEIAKAQMNILEAKRGGGSTDKIIALAKKYWPLISTALAGGAGGGGIAAILAEPGAFKGLLAKLGFGIGG